MRINFLPRYKMCHQISKSSNTLQSNHHCYSTHDFFQAAHHNYCWYQEMVYPSGTRHESLKHVVKGLNPDECIYGENLVEREIPPMSANKSLGGYLNPLGRKQIYLFAIVCNNNNYC